MENMRRRITNFLSGAKTERDSAPKTAGKSRDLYNEDVVARHKIKTPQCEIRTDDINERSITSINSWGTEKPSIGEDTELPSAQKIKKSTGTLGDTESPRTPGDTQSPDAPGDTESPRTPGDTQSPDAPGDTQSPERSLESSLSNPASRTNPDLHQNPPSGFSRKFVTIWSWNEMSWLSDYLNMYSSIKGLIRVKDCMCVCLKGNQKPPDDVIDRSSRCIIVYCNSSEELNNMEHFLHRGVKANGSQSFLVIIGGFTDETSMNQMREDWTKRPYSSCRLLLFTKNDIKFLQQLTKNKAKSWISMNEKLDNITEIISKESKVNMTKDASSQNSTKNNEKLPIGIFSLSGDEWPWLNNLLEMRLPGDEVKHFKDRQHNSTDPTSDLCNCSFYIFLVTIKKWPRDQHFITLYKERNVQAEERNVHAEEKNVQAEERNVHAEEKNVQAEERNAHAEERNVQAEERNVQAEERNVHAEEKNVQAEERNVHAEEKNVQAEERNVHAEEKNVQAEERNAHAEERSVLPLIDDKVTSWIKMHQKNPSHFDRLDTVKVMKGKKSIYETFSSQNDAEAVARIHKQLFELEELVSGRVNSHKIMEKEEHRESGFVQDQKTDSSSVMGIFSRSAESDYEWLQVLLRSESFRDQIQVVRSFYISNNKMAQFIDDVRQCKFGILYHTQNRGRINITDVTDSLYDEELEIMSTYLGSDNVLVVADDLNDSSDEEKQRILESQPKIQKFAADLLLVAETEKEDETCLLKKLKGVNLFKS